MRKQNFLGVVIGRFAVVVDKMRIFQKFVEQWGSNRILGEHPVNGMVTDIPFTGLYSLLLRLILLVVL